MLGLILILVLLIPILAIVLDSHVGKALAARLERGNPGEIRGVQERLNFLEGEVERLGRELDRVDEANQFLHGLLEGREEPVQLPPGDEDAPGRESAD